MGKWMYGWPSSNQYFVVFISTLADASLSLGICIDPLWGKRVTQTWLMRWYWLWLLWQLLIRDWLGTVAICWGGWKETVCHDLVELLLLQPPTPLLSTHIKCERSMKQHKETWVHIVWLHSATWCWATEAERRLKLIRSSTSPFSHLVSAVGTPFIHYVWL